MTAIIAMIFHMKSMTAAALFPTPLSLEEAAALSPKTILLAVQGWCHAEQQVTRFQA